MKERAAMAVSVQSLFELCQRSTVDGDDTILFPHGPLEYGNLAWLQGQLRDLWGTQRVFVLPSAQVTVMEVPTPGREEG